MFYKEMNKEELLKEKDSLQKEFDGYKAMGLKLDMSRGKPGKEQLDISERMLDIVNSGTECKTRDGLDCRNYGLLDGIPSCKELFSQLLGVEPENVMVGGNSSLDRKSVV